MQEMHDEKMTEVSGRYRTALTIWVMMLWSIFLFILMTFLIERVDGPEIDRRLFIILQVLCLVAALASFIMKGVLMKRAVRERSMERVIQAYIFTFALCETSSLVGLVSFFLRASSYYYLFLPGLFCLLLHMPRRERLLAVTYGGAD
jgi:F0F1-type ATP synthase membrane subunit c/vacuolar-type H+-ATPase subunit K